MTARKLKAVERNDATPFVPGEHPPQHHSRNEEWRRAFRQLVDAKIARLDVTMAEAGGRYYDTTMDRLIEWRARLA